MALSAYRSPVTALLLSINVTIFIVMVVSSGSIASFSGQTLIRWGANYGPLTLSGDYWRLLTAAFVHANPFHILVNGWGLWSLGQLCERLFGKWQTLLIYVLTGVGGSLLSIAYDNNRLSVGASGALFGIVGALIAGLKFGDLALSAGQRRSMLSSLVSVVVLNFMLGTFGGIDNMCHLGGFVTGLLVGLPLGAFARKHQLLQLGTFVVTAVVLAVAGQELVQNHGTEAQKQAALLAWSRKDFGRAVRHLERYAASRPDDDVALVMLGEAYANNHETEKAVAALERALKINPNSMEARQDLEELRGSTPESKDK